MTTTTAATITTDAALLRLLWLASPALPVGGFSYSEGLEAAVDAGLVANEEQAGAWLADQLHLVLARSDMAVVARAVEAWRTADSGTIRELDTWVRRTRETSESKLQSEQMGRSLAQLVLAPQDDLTYPVAFALAASPCTSSVREIALAFAFSWAENMMQSAIKAVPLGQAAGQRILARLAREIPAAVDHALALQDADRQSFAPMLAILSSRHETQYSRLFRS
ncbi:MAG TPA: urease accessory UreF family protein [Ramlibacter sp.]|uniref:urease accessory protein UreF n=1 Tax=Ramlibacter sp. TaxID=1917967 RepID=UPI002C968913|nr:urease accessory UreF family protein [Ramlibacter sp.]HVZ45106.1 urease accessory UreF family protein [Ramlibacter sp.]